jgi:hypothetical protein
MRLRLRGARLVQPELWLVLGIPLAALAGGVATLRAVAGDLSSDGAAEGVRRTAQVQDADLAPDLAAARRGLVAGLRIDRARGEVEVTLPPRARDALPATLAFVHHLRAGEDRRVALQPRGAGRWSAPGAPDAAVGWRVVLEGGTTFAPGGTPQRWRLVGALPRGAEAAALQPAIAAP